jgi:uncharacterized protein
MRDSLLKYCLPGRLRFLAIFLLAATVAGAVDLSSIPKPTGFVSDLAHVLTPSDQADLEVFCVKVKEQLGAQFAIVTIPTLGDQPIEDFSLDLFRKWGIGPKANNEGLLMLLVIQDHKRRIEVGRGLEPYITDSFAGDTGRAMEPVLRSGDFGGALKQAALALATRLAQGKNVSFSETLPVPTPQAQPQNGSGGGIPWPFIIFAAIFLLMFILSRRGGGGRGSGTGFWTGMILSSLLNTGGRGGGGGSWGGGGGFGGGSGGGGGFGGFGGGDSGGGGASGGW